MGRANLSCLGRFARDVEPEHVVALLWREGHKEVGKAADARCVIGHERTSDRPSPPGSNELAPRVAGSGQEMDGERMVEHVGIDMFRRSEACSVFEKWLESGSAGSEEVGDFGFAFLGNAVAGDAIIAGVARVYRKMPSNERVVVPGPPAGGFQVAISAVRAWLGDEDLSVVPVSARALKISHLLRVLADE